jgi:hypothetical protein
VACILQVTRNQSTWSCTVHMLSSILSAFLDNIGPSTRYRARVNLNVIHLFKLLFVLIEGICQKQFPSIIFPCVLY